MNTQRSAITAIGALTSFFLFAISPVTFCQDLDFVPADADPSTLSAIEQKHHLLFQQTISTLPSRHQSDYKTIYHERWENIQEIFDKREIYTSSEANDYLGRLVSEIINSNKILANEAINCYFSRSGTPNASHFGEGVILFNMGLFSRLQNESQVAYVICHEIAHLHLRHSEAKIARYVEEVNSPRVQSELNRIRRNEYGKRQLLESLVKRITFTSRRHSRENESSADSLAMQLLLNTKFDAGEAISALRILDSIDVDTINTNECLQQMFNFEQYPFKPKWITRESGLLSGHAKLGKDVFEDSLKTHPDCKSRIEALKHKVQRSEASNLNVVDVNRFQQLRKRFIYETIEYEYSAKHYSKSLYYTLRALQANPSDPYLNTHVARVLNEMYQAQKKHELGKCVDLPTPQYNASYNQLLQFIQNLYAENLAALSFHYLDQYRATLSVYPLYNATYEVSKANFQNK